MTKEIKTKSKELSTVTKYKIRKYVLLAQSLLLGAAGALAILEAYKLHTHDTVFYLAVVAGVYAVVEALGKLDKAIAK